MDDASDVETESVARPEDRSQSNRFDRLEWAGTFGDLGTLLPFLIAYLAVLKVDPQGVLFAFGFCMLATGLSSGLRSPFSR